MPSEEQMKQQAEDMQNIAAEPPTKYAMPPLDKGAKCFYDDEARVVWVGLPIGLIDPLGASIFLDAAKLDFLKRHIEVLPKMIEERNRRASLSVKVKEGVGSMMDRLSKIIH